MSQNNNNHLPPTRKRASNSVSQKPNLPTISSVSETTQGQSLNIQITDSEINSQIFNHSLFSPNTKDFVENNQVNLTGNSALGNLSGLNCHNNSSYYCDQNTEDLLFEDTTSSKNSDSSSLIPGRRGGRPARNYKNGQEKHSHLEPKLNPLTHEQIKCMLIICFINFASCMGYTVLSTFIPIESEARGVTPSQNALIFAIYAAVNVISSPIFGYYLPTLGAKFMLFSGMILSTACYICFSFLDKEHDPTNFVIISCIIRVFTAVASSQYLTAAYAIMTHVWAERRTQAVGLMEMTTGIGMILGPICGSALYNYGGFGLPFRLMAGVFILGLPLVFAVIKNVDLGRRDDVLNSLMLSNQVYFWGR